MGKSTVAELVEERNTMREEALARVKAAIDADPTSPHRMATLARIALMGQWYFQHSFTDRYGIPPGRYVTLARFAVMRDLLETTNLPIRAVIYDAGFSSLGTSATNFKRRVGCSPTDYRMWAAYARELGRPTQP